MKKGFTLIELLVVVLIIGILSAVAMPQYTKAVEKSRASEALSMLKTLREQQALCLLEAGGWADYCGGGEDNLFNSSSVELKGNPAEECDDPVCGPATKDFSYGLDGQYIIATRRPGGKYSLETTAFDNGNEIVLNRVSCNNADESTDYCKMIGFKKEWNVYFQP